jgi:hypothetical protein
MKKYGFSFSWKRALGVSAAKSKLSRRIGVPLTRSGRQRKVGRTLGCSVAIAALVAPLALLISIHIATTKWYERAQWREKLHDCRSCVSCVAATPPGTFESPEPRTMRFEDLVQFVERDMRMSHVYQAVMLRELLDRGGRASRNVWRRPARDSQLEMENSRKG